MLGSRFKSKLLRLKWLYLQLFQLLAATRIDKQDLDLRVIHAHTVSVLTTGALMWAYAFLAWLTIGHPLPGRVGFVASLVHLLSPLLFLISNNGLLVCSVMLGAGMLHQATFAFFTGGFESPLLIWFGILPMLAGIIVGRRGVILWSFFAVAVAFPGLLMDIMGYPFPNLISQTGFLIAQALMVFGWIFLSTAVIGVHLILQGKYEQALAEKNNNISELLRVLTHDVNTPLAVIAMAIPSLRASRDRHSREASDMVDKAYRTLIEISDSVRKLYAVESGGQQIHCRAYSLNQAMEETTALLQNSLKRKGISLHYDYQANQGRTLWVDPAIFNNQILVNILSNAIKFSFPNSHIEVNVEEREERIQVAIRDHGIGMPTEIIEQLFVVGADISRPGTGAEQGSGYGMMIMKSFLEKLQGEVKVCSEVWHEGAVQSGTEFRLVLPCGRA